MSEGTFVFHKMGEIYWQTEDTLASQERALLHSDILTANVASIMKHSELFYSYIVGISVPAFSVTPLRRCIVTMFDYRHF